MYYEDDGLENRKINESDNNIDNQYHVDRYKNIDIDKNDSVDGHINGYYDNIDSPNSHNYEYSQPYKEKSVDDFIPWLYDANDDAINESQGGVYGEEYRYEIKIFKPYVRTRICLMS